MLTKLNLKGRNRVFICYFRKDDAGAANLLRRTLEDKFWKGFVFQDRESNVGGDDFIRNIDLALSQCRVMLVIIGPNWLHSLTAGSGWVNDEIRKAQANATKIIPVFHKASMPKPRDVEALPDNPQGNELKTFLRGIVTLTGYYLDDDRDVDRLITQIRGLVSETRTRRRRSVAVIAGATTLAVILAIPVISIYRPRYLPTSLNVWLRIAWEEIAGPPIKPAPFLPADSLLEPRVAFSADPEFHSGLAYWAIADRGHGGPFVTSEASGKPVQIRLPSNTGVTISQSNIGLRKYDNRPTILEVIGSIRKLGPGGTIRTLIDSSDGRMLLDETASLNPGPLILRRGLENIDDRGVRLRIEIDSGMEPGDPLSIQLSRIAIESIVPPRSLLLSLWQPGVGGNHFVTQHWSNFYEVHRVNASGQLEELWNNVRFANAASTLVSGLEPGMYRVGARFFGIHYESKDVILPVDVGAPVPLMSGGRGGRVQLQVVDSGRKPIVDAEVIVLTSDGSRTYAPQRTGRNGTLSEALWLIAPDSVRHPDEYYSIEVYVHGELRARREKFIPQFPYGAAEILETIVVSK